MNGDDINTVETEAEAGAMPPEPSAPVMPSAPPPAVPRGRPVVGGAPLTGYAGFDASIVAQAQARRNENDRVLAQYLLENQRIAGAQKAVELAIRFQAMRSFGRDVEMGLAQGLDQNTATARAAARNPTALGGGGQAAAFIRATMPPSVSQVPVKPGQALLVGGRAYFPPAGMFPQSTTLTEQTVGGKKYVVSPKTGAFRQAVNPAEEARKNIAVANVKSINSELNKLTAFGSTYAKQVAALREEKAKALREAGLADEAPTPVVPPPTAPPAPVTPPAAAAPVTGGAPDPNYAYQSELDARAAGNGPGDIVRIRGVGRVRLK